MTMVVGMFTYLMIQYGSIIYIHMIQSFKFPLQLHIISIHYWLGCLRKKIIRDSTMWDQTYGCANQYVGSISYYMISFLSQSYQIVIDRAVDTPGHDKYVVDGFNAVQKWYLSTCFIMRSTLEVDKIGSRHNVLMPWPRSEN